MQKRPLAIALVASMLVVFPLACSSSSNGTTDTGDGGTGGGGDSGTSGGGDSGTAGGDGGSSNKDSGTVDNDSGLLADGGSGITGCGDNGDPGNSVGIGKYCTSFGGQCTSGLICATLGGSDTDTWCTKPCTPPDAGGSPTVCGAGASCQCQDGQCGCTPDACL